MIRLRQIQAGYPGRSVLKGINLEIRSGEVLAILGLNGCGKSTLLRTAVGLLPKEAGEIWIGDSRLEHLSMKERARRVAYLPQVRPVPNITAEKLVLHGRFPHLGYPRRYSAEDQRAAAEALGWGGAVELAERRLPELSGGQRQKVYLAMALAQDTPAILLDEPTTYLDMAGQLEVMELIGRLAEEGRAVAAVLHDLCLALRYAHRILLLDQGKEIAVGTPLELYESHILEQMMGVSLGYVETEGGRRYYYR